ncbi:hypothetical protein [Paenibacillus sp. W2I17]|uniref:hypothetical protein n=1 Tax=Paenibacillus sp. W2I17 TaxID=3042311 RepID=UPI0027D8FA58|nr:hypothetical protein [Paenibacillus sp. W2I17]
MASKFVHSNPFFHKRVVLYGTAVGDKRTVLHMWTSTVRASDTPTTTQTADRTNPWNLLHTTWAYTWIERGKDRPSAACQTSRSRWGEQMVEALGKVLSVIGHVAEPVKHNRVNLQSGLENLMVCRKYTLCVL